jgi:hypothetical protein
MGTSKASFIVSFCASLVFLMTGCYTTAVVNFGNGTSTAVKVKSSQTGQELNVKPGRFQKLPHAVGDIIVTTQTDGKLKFSGVEPPAMDSIAPNYLIKRKSLLGAGSVTLNVLLQTNMNLYALLPGKRTVDTSVPQPEGYPKAGKKVTD